MSIQIIQRRDYAHNWATAETQGKGLLDRGQIAIAIVTDDGTDTGNITEVIGRIGPSDTPTPFSDCPVVFRSPRGFKGADVRPVLMPETPANGSIVAWDGVAQDFRVVADDPGTYEVDNGDDGSEGEQQGDTVPTIVVATIPEGTAQLEYGQTRTWSISVDALGSPTPDLLVEVDYVETDPANPTGVPNVISKVYEFSTSSVPTGLTLTTSTTSPLSEGLGTRNFTITGFEVSRSTTVNVTPQVRIVANNAAGSSPASTITGASTQFRSPTPVSDPPPRIASLGIASDGVRVSAIDNPATGASVTFTATSGFDNFTAGVDGGAVSWQWYQDGQALAGETSDTVTLINTADALNDSSISVQATIANDFGSDTQSAFVTIGAAVAGWTNFTQYLEATSRIMYVSANGNDATGVAYAPNDAAIGADPTQPVGAVQAFATYEAARANMRNFEADWILFRRGDTFTLANGLFSHSAHTFFEHDPNGPLIRKVFGAYGPETDARPILTAPTGALIAGFAIGNRQYANSAFVSLDLRAGGVQDNNATVFRVSGNRGFHFEDCRLRGGGAFFPYTPYDPDPAADPPRRYPGDIVFRRCVVVDTAKNEGGHVQGMYASGVDGLLLEECVFDRNGYVEDPRDPSAWTAKLKTDNQNTDPLPAGEGVQPHRTWFSRNLYLESYTHLAIRGCILTRSGSAHQMRVGGVAERNVFMWNDQALAPKTQGGREFLQGQTLSKNLVLHDDHLLAQSVSSAGMTASVGETYEAVVDDNIVTGFNWDASYTFGAQGLEASGDFPAEVGARATFTGNISYAKGGTAFSLRGTRGEWWNGYHEIDGSNNVSAFDEFARNVNTTELAAPAGWDFGGNHYTTGSYRRGHPFDVDYGPFPGWQDAGFDVGTIEYADVAALAAAVGWETTPDAQGRRGWERDIVSYMQSIDPAYVVDENVTVDDGVPAANRRANAPKVWEVLAGLHAPSANLVSYMSEADAKLAARRYHAFLTFIERARANRKGAWDVNYTADALNNHIREGFGKELVGGAYTAVLPEEAA